jgi:hypothetical protein
MAGLENLPQADTFLMLDEQISALHTPAPREGLLTQLADLEAEGMAIVASQGDSRGMRYEVASVLHRRFMEAGTLEVVPPLDESQFQQFAGKVVTYSALMDMNSSITPPQGPTPTKKSTTTAAKP